MRKTLLVTGIISVAPSERKRNNIKPVLIAMMLLALLIGTTVIATAQPELSKLVMLTEADPQVTFSTRVPVQVRYLDPSGVPIPDTFIAFEPQSDMAGTTLSARNALTNSDGVAETYIEAGVQEVDFDIKISVFDDDSVPPLFVSVRVQPKDDSDYIIRVNYGESHTLHSVEVLLYDIDRACNTLIEDPSAPPSPDTAWTQLVLLPDAEGNIPDRELNIPPVVELHYAVARATATLADGSGTDYFVTFGCNDNIPPLDPMGPTLIEITMSDLYTEAADDSYTTEKDTELVVPPPGVLANDEESPDVSMPMLTVLKAGPAHGSVKLTGEGGFVYTPNPDYCGADEYLYFASNGILHSNPATVFVDVTCVEDRAEKLRINEHDWDYDWSKHAIVVPLLSKFGIAKAGEHASFTAYVEVMVTGKDGTITGAGTGSGAIKIDDEDWDMDHYVRIQPVYVESLEWKGDDDGSGIVTGHISLVNPGGKTISTTYFYNVTVNFLPSCPDCAPGEFPSID